jgi:hypothetical protein
LGSPDAILAERVGGVNINLANLAKLVYHPIVATKVIWVRLESPLLEKFIESADGRKLGPFALKLIEDKLKPAGKKGTP